MPGFLGGPQSPPSKLKDGMIERRNQEFVLGPAAAAQAVKPPPFLQDANHSVPIAKSPP